MPSDYCSKRTKFTQNGQTLLKGPLPILQPAKDGVDLAYPQSSVAVTCCERGVTCYDIAVSQCDRAESQFDRAVSQFNRAVSFG